jgi:hypothetical protein
MDLLKKKNMINKSNELTNNFEIDKEKFNKISQKLEMIIEINKFTAISNEFDMKFQSDKNLFNKISRDIAIRSD